MIPEEVSTWIEENLRVGVNIQQNILYSVVTIVVLLVLRWLVNLVVRRRTEDAELIYRWRKVTEYVMLFIGALTLLLIWLPDAGSVATYLGLLSAGLAIALQAPISDFVGWIFIVWRHPFSVGDRIQIGLHRGDVVDIRYFQFSIMEVGNWVDADQSTGRVLHIPNKNIFTEALANYSKGLAHIWNEMIVDVTFESDWQKAKEILTVIATEHASELSDVSKKRLKEASQRYFISHGKLTPIVYTRVVEHGVRLTIRYLTRPRQRRSTEASIWEDILRAFGEEPTIEFAYPTVRRYIHPEEAKPMLRPDVYYGRTEESE